MICLGANLLNHPFQLNKVKATEKNNVPAIVITSKETEDNRIFIPPAFSTDQPLNKITAFPLK